MVGICGVAGEEGARLGPMVDAISGEGDVNCLHREDALTVCVATHLLFHGDQAAPTDDGRLIWILGEVYGAKRSGGYEARADLASSTSLYCADLYDEVGMEFVGLLNGEFAGVVYDPSAGDTALFTDRLGTWPLFYRAVDGALLFASRLQAIGLHPAVSPRFDPTFLAEFFAVQKAFGTATPLQRVSKAPPATILTVDRDGSVTNRRTYWRPTYRPVRRSPAELSARLAEALERTFANRLRPDLEYGVLLSGGSDSRLVLGATLDHGHIPTAFHLTNWASRETRTAERVASVAGVDFRSLTRGRDYHEELLAETPTSSDFIGTFDEFIASGFADELGRADVLLTGYLGDTMFGDFPIFTRGRRLPVDLPLERRVTSIPDFVDLYLDRYDTSARVPEFLDAPDISEVMHRHVRSDDGAIVHHGIRYRSLRELQLCEYYPLTNQFAYANTDSLRQIAGHWSPFFDTRLVDLHLTVPVRDRLRRGPIDHAMTRLSPELAAIPHSGTGVAPGDSTALTPGYLLRRALSALQRRVSDPSPPSPYLDHGSWMDEATLIRTREFIPDTIDRNRDVVAGLSFLDPEGVDRCYRDHLSGADNWRALYGLATLLETPLAQRVASERR